LKKLRVKPRRESYHNITTADRIALIITPTNKLPPLPTAGDIESSSPKSSDNTFEASFSGANNAEIGIINPFPPMLNGLGVGDGVTVG
jgi:hypothetical protein